MAAKKATKKAAAKKSPARATSARTTKAKSTRAKAPAKAARKPAAKRKGGTASVPGISRIDQESTRTHGYFVRVGFVILLALQLYPLGPPLESSANF